jgi:hypothetical protein
MNDQKVVLLHGFSPEEALAVIRTLKTAVPSASDAAFATSTETNLGWKLGDLIEHVAEEHRHFRELPKKA